MDLFVNSDITLGFQKLLDLPFFADGTYQENEAPTNIGYKHWLLLTDFFNQISMCIVIVHIHMTLYIHYLHFKIIILNM